MGRIFGTIPLNATVYRYEPKDIETPMQPHDSPYFDVIKSMEYKLPRGHYYDALFVVKEEGDNLDKLTVLRNKQGYFESDVVLRKRTVDEILKEHPDIKVLEDYRFNGTTIGRENGAYIFVKKRKNKMINGKYFWDLRFFDIFDITRESIAPKFQKAWGDNYLDKTIDLLNRAKDEFYKKEASSLSTEELWLILEFQYAIGGHMPKEEDTLEFFKWIILQLGYIEKS